MVLASNLAMEIPATAAKRYVDAIAYGPALPEKLANDCLG